MVQARILLVEDGSTYAKLATVLLTAGGYAVVWAATAEDGLRLAREAAPDLILMDINLPDMDGMRAVSMLRQDPRTRHIPTVGLTADRILSEQEHQTAREAGFDAYVEKPTDNMTFRALIEPFLGSPQGLQ